MNHSGITERLIKFVNNIVGRVRGGLAYANIVTSMLFAGITGAAISDVAALGSVFIPSMVEEGYSREFSSTITAASSIVGPIIPPSIIIVVYGSVSGVSIGALFTAAIVPGLILGLSMIFLTGFYARKRNFPKIETKFSLKEFVSLTKDAVLALLFPIIIMGGIVLGIFTPTEAAAVAVLYGLLISILIYRSIALEDLYLSLKNTVRISSMLFLLIAVGTFLGWIIARVRLSVILADLLLSFTGHPTIVFLIVTLFLLFVGTWLDSSATIIIFAPIFAPMMQLLGFHPLHFATVMVVTICVGLITPPLGVCVFTVAGVGKVKIESVFKEIWPFVLIDITVIVLLILFPEFSLFLPRLLGFAV